MVQSIISELTQAPFWAAVLQIALINILLSGDNAVIIAMACRELPRSQRMLGIVLGSGVGVILRLAFTGAIAWLFELPYFKLAGGLALLYIGAKLLVPGDAEAGRVEAAVRLWRAVWIVVVADIVMSFDNILALVEIAKDDVALLAIGLAISIPLVVFGAALVAALLDRVPLLVWAGAALLGWVAGQTIVGDAAIADLVRRAAGGKLAGSVDLAAGCVGGVLVIAAGGLWRRRGMAKARAGTIRRGRTP